MTDNIFFGIGLTIIVFIAAQALAKKTKITLLNPLLVSSIIVIILLLAFKIPYSDYNQGGKFFTFLIGPATVSLAIPLYKNLDTLKANIKVIGIGIVVAIVSHFMILLGLFLVYQSSPEIALSLIPKSITTAFANDVSSAFGGIEVITISVVIVTGIFGATIAPILNSFFKFKDDRAIGLALGSSAHAIGTSKAVETNEIQGTFSSLALILTGLLTVIVAPALVFVVQLFI